MITISLCMIVRDEEAVLGRCLQSVRDLVEEIVVVDTGSADGTKEVAAAYADKVLDFPWQEDFAAARNFSFYQAGQQYCFWLDADDLLLEEDRQAFRQLKEELTPAADVVMLPYHIAFDAQGKPTFTYYRERLVKNHAGFRWQGAVHEAIPPTGNIVYGNAAVTHRKERPRDPERNLRILERIRDQGVAFGPRERFYYARELSDHGRFQQAAQELEALLAARQGWLPNLLDACRLLAQCRTALGDSDGALEALLTSLTFAPPAGELCCDLGRHFFQREQWEQAIFWYQLALTRPMDEASGGFIQPDCYGYLPAIQLCVCYDRLGNRTEAIRYNELAGSYRPQDPSYQYNKQLFDGAGQ